jgi:hypothetical protein
MLLLEAQGNKMGIEHYFINFLGVQGNKMGIELKGGFKC